MTKPTGNGTRERVRTSFTIAADVWQDFESIAQARGMEATQAVRVMITEHVAAQRDKAVSPVWDELLAYSREQGLTPEQAWHGLLRGRSEEAADHLPRGDPLP